MTGPLDRRGFLRRTMFGMSWLAAPGRPAPWTARGGRDLAGLIRWIVEVERAAAPREAFRRLRAGLSPVDLTAATFCAGALEIAPCKNANFNHVVLAIAATRGLAARGDRRAGETGLLWYLDYFKRWQERDALRGDWRLHPAERLPRTAGREVLARLRAGLERWDAEKTDRALVAAVHEHGLEPALGVVLEYGARCRTNIGHKAIYASMARRMSRELPGDLALDAVRAAVSSFSEGGPGPESASFDRARELASAWPAAPESPPARDASAASEVCAALRTVSVEDALDLVPAALHRGVGEADVWDGIVLSCAEQVLNDGNLHALTSANALRSLALESGYEHVARTALLQAASWCVLFRERMSSSVVETLDSLEPLALDEGDTLPERVFGRAGSSRVDAARRALTAARGDPGRWISESSALVAGRSDSVHQHKGTVAFHEEARRVSPPLAPRILAASSTQLPDPRAPLPEELEPIVRALG